MSPRLPDPQPSGRPPRLRAIGTAARAGARVAAWLGDRPGPGARAAYRLWLALHDRLPPHRLEQLAPPAADGVVASFLLAPAAGDEGGTAARTAATLRSLGAQVDPRWELLVAPTLGTPELGTAELGTAASGADPRVRPINLGLPAAAALGAARGDLVGVLAPGDRLAPHAVAMLARARATHPAARLYHADEDGLDTAGRRCRPRLRSLWDPESLLAGGEATAVFAVPRGRALATAPDELPWEPGARFRLALAWSDGLTESDIVHLTELLAHRPLPRPDPGRAAHHRQLAAHLRQVAPGAQVETARGRLRIRWPVPRAAPLVSAVIPSRDQPGLLARCLQGLLEETDYPALEVVVVDNASSDADARELLRRAADGGRVRLVRDEGDFNFSRLSNRGAAAARGELIAFLNNDLEVLHPGWLREMVGHALRPDVGAVGARLLYPDGTVQHGGVLLGAGAPRDAVAGHLLHGLPGDAPGPGGRALRPISPSAATGACLLMARATFERIGRFDADDLAVAFNDIDLCLRLRAEGLRVVCTPHARLLHHESASRGDDLAAPHRARFRREVATMRRRWGPLLDEDPFYHPCLDPLRADFALAWPPRRRRPWEAD